MTVSGGEALVLAAGFGILHRVCLGCSRQLRDCICRLHQDLPWHRLQLFQQDVFDPEFRKREAFAGCGSYGCNDEILDKGMVSESIGYEKGAG